MKKLLLLITLSTAAATLVGCTGLYEPYPVVSSGSDIHQTHHHYTSHYHQGPVVHTRGNNNISQSHY